ncbi:MAG: VacJ family lipoprotein [Thermodesulfobacteriota bacterium]|nr:VacJ family lipoprotein [Thermodesulfobacteriota bacterium]
MKCFWIMVLICMLSLTSSLYADENQAFDDVFEDYKIAEEEERIPDPLYWFNHGMYTFNDKLYYWFLKPLAKGYETVAPAGFRQCVHSFFYNILFPVRFVNNVIQGKIKGAGSELGIFLINTTAGPLGLSKPAQTVFNMKNSREDLGQTLGAWKIGEGCYLVLPFFGPSTLRDFLGLAGDSFLSPIHYVDSTLLAAGIRSFDAVNTLSLNPGKYEALKQSSFDPYDAFKNAYIQSRRLKVSE